MAEGNGPVPGIDTPDFAVVDNLVPSSSGPSENQTSEDQQAPPDGNKEPDVEPQTEAKGEAGDPWAAIQKAHPDLTVEKLREMASRDKNLQAGYTKKYMGLSDERKEFEASREAHKATLSMLETDQGKLALEIAQQCQDPLQEERLRRAVEQIALAPDEEVEARIKRGESLVEQKMATLEARIASLQEAKVVEEEAAFINKLGQAETNAKLLPGTLERVASALYEQHKANGVSTEDHDKFLAEAVIIAKAEQDAHFQSRLKGWKDGHNGKGAPVSGTGGTSPASSGGSSSNMDTEDGRVDAFIAEFEQ